jgi:hypothetical protein
MPALVVLVVKSGNEYGWRKDDVLNVIEAARKLGIAIIGGQVQYRLPNATCELYWLSYDSEDRKPNESWIDYCNRAAFECGEKFKSVAALDIEKELLTSFKLDKVLLSTIILSDYQVFILYFADQ